MTNRQLIAAVRREIKKTNIYMVTFAMGYRSPNTILAWLKNEKVPNVAFPKVLAFLQKGKTK